MCDTLYLFSDQTVEIIACIFFSNRMGNVADIAQRATHRATEKDTTNYFGEFLSGPKSNHTIVKLLPPVNTLFIKHPLLFRQLLHSYRCCCAFSDTRWLCLVRCHDDQVININVLPVDCFLCVYRPVFCAHGELAFGIPVHYTVHDFAVQTYKDKV